MSGYCSLQAISMPSGRVARCTWPRLAAAAASRPKRAKRRSQSGPSSEDMRRRTKGQPMGGALDCSVASCCAYSSGSASGTVERNCATFISGPFSPPSTAFRSSACADLSVLMPRKRWPATRAAIPPTAPEVRAIRRISPKMVLSLLRSDIGAPGPVAAPEALQLVDEAGDDVEPAPPEARVGGVEAEGRQQLPVPLGAAGAE